MNVVLLVVDSMRAHALAAVRAPFLARLARESTVFTRAYSTECWTLPSHTSMFTGLLPSEHGAHFQTMGYTGSQPTVADLLSSAGFHTEVVTRNSIFDGSMPGVTRGFRSNTRVFSARRGLNPLSLMLAMTKPRFRRQIMTSGFFHPRQRESREFVASFARATVPADREALSHVFGTMRRCRDARQPFFLFANLYDVHAPYPPAERSIFRPLSDPRTWRETLHMPFVLPRLGGHAYLREGFSLSPLRQRLLLGRYHSSIELMDAKLAAFYEAAHAEGLLDDTVLIVTSDHGEAFGEHGLYLHDASVYDKNLHVPLMVRHPRRAPAVVHDVVSTRDLFGVLRGVADGSEERGTILDPTFRAAHQVAIAEHFHYPAIDNPRYRRNLVSAIVGTHKVIVRDDEVLHFDLARDADELAPVPGAIDDFAPLARAEDASEASVAAALRHLRTFQAQHRAPRPGRGAGGTRGQPASYGERRAAACKASAAI